MYYCTNYKLGPREQYDLYNSHIVRNHAEQNRTNDPKEFILFVDQRL